MEGGSQDSISKIFSVEIAVGFVYFIILITTGMRALALIYLTPVIALIFLAEIGNRAIKYNWQPVGWKVIFGLNVILTWYI